jgi:hypothetical protein
MTLQKALKTNQKANYLLKRKKKEKKNKQPFNQLKY